MKWRVMSVMSFDTEKQARGLWTAIKAIQNVGMKQRDDHANIHRCYHDEDPFKPCVVVEELKPVASHR